MSLEKEFIKCVDHIKNSKKMDIDNNTKLYFYAHYKQALIGNCNIEKPTGLFDISNKLKYEAWNNLKGLSQNDAKKNYIKKFNELISK